MKFDRNIVSHDDVVQIHDFGNKNLVLQHSFMTQTNTYQHLYTSK